MAENKSFIGFQSIYGNKYRNENGDRIGYVKEFHSLPEVREWAEQDPDYREQLSGGGAQYFRGENILNDWREIMRRYDQQIRHMDEWAKVEYLTKVSMGVHREMSTEPDHDKNIIERFSPKSVDKMNMV